MSPNSHFNGLLHVRNDHPVKRRAACEQCRTRKLKCSGNQPTCARCVRENIACIYSVQKQMGRPKKRPRTNSVGHCLPSTQGAEEGRSGQSAGTSGDEQVAREGVDEGNQTQPESHSAWIAQPVASWISDDVSVESARPALTPDAASNSPPLLHLPPELQRHFSSGPSSQLHVDSSMANVDFGAECSLLSGLSSCACLSTMYLSLNNLQQMAQPYQFPFSLHPLREAMSTATSVLRCEECPQRFITGLQNTQMIGTLLVSIAERFGKVLDSITTEAVRAEMHCETKKFRLADLNTETSHLHLGGLGCAAAFSIDLSPDEWRSMSKKVVRAEVHGPHLGISQSSSITSSDATHSYPHAEHGSQTSHGFSDVEHASCACLMGVINQMLLRQERWHKDSPPNDFPLDKQGNMVGGMRSGAEDHLCMKMPAYAAKLVQAFDWT
nr:monodictyphenone cluster transcription factor [Quercus suber]